MNLAIKSILDKSLPLTSRYHIVLNMYRIQEDIKKKGLDTLEELSDIFEGLTLFMQEFDEILRNVTLQFTTIKADVATLKKGSRIRWMNDVEQKTADIKDLLLADGGVPFVD